MYFDWYISTLEPETIYKRKAYMKQIGTICRRPNWKKLREKFLKPQKFN